MSIASELSRLQQAKSDLATSIENKGVTVPAATTLDGYAALVDQIQQSGELPCAVEIEYLEGTGTQWIDTGIQSVIGDSVSITVSTTSFGASFLCGARASSNNMLNSFFIYGAANNIVNFAANNTYVSSNVNVQDGEIHTIEHKQDGGYIDGVKKVSLSITQAPSTRPYAIFTVNDRTAPTNICSCKLYGFTYKRNDVVIMDLIPVRVCQFGYMYDRVSKQLFGNSGTGNFTLGSDKN